MPGSLENSLTAFSSRRDENCWFILDFAKLPAKIEKKSKIAPFVIVRNLEIQEYVVIFACTLLFK